MIRGPKTINGAEQTAVKAAPPRIERRNAVLTQSMSPDARASEYAGHNGTRTKPRMVGATKNSFKGTAYSLTASAPRILEMIR
jgi:hypothetical protein